MGRAGRWQWQAKRRTPHPDRGNLYRGTLPDFGGGTGRLQEVVQRLKMVSPEGYDLDATAPSFVAAQEDYARRSKTAGDLPGAMLDVPYGDQPRHRIDVFSAGASTPVILFLRGGYWRAGSKEERRFPAKIWRERGVALAVPNYRLAPEFSLDEIVEDARASLLFLIENAERLGIDPKQVHLVGNSAGGHLAALLAADANLPPAASLTLISGLFDLDPLLEASANNWLRLDRDTARRLSPVHSLPPASVPVTVCCGGLETEAFKFQSSLYAKACLQNGNSVGQFESPGKNHIQVIGDLDEPNSRLFGELESTIQSTALS